jgi:hypothetical protein
MEMLELLPAVAAAAQTNRQTPATELAAPAGLAVLF